MLPLSSSPSPSSTTSPQYCSLKRVLIPLICILIVFLVHTNVRGLYLEYSAMSSGSKGLGLMNPIVPDAAGKTPKNMDKEAFMRNNNNDAEVEDQKREVERFMEQLQKQGYPSGTGNGDENPFAGMHITNDNYDYVDDEFFYEENYGSCFRENVTNYYRPPNITNVTLDQAYQLHYNNLNNKTRTNKKRKRKSRPVIPRRLIFTYRTNLFHCDFPKHLYDNVQKTIQLYADFWKVPNNTDVDVLFFDDNECADIIQAVEPRLSPVFKAENNGAYRGDICRIAALYQYGGYYLDVDIEPIQALDPPPKVDFVTASALNNLFFQAVLAVKPRHPLLKHTLETMLDDWYMIPKIMKDFKKTKYDAHWFRSQEYTDLRKEHVVKFGFDPKHHIGILMGPATLRIAYDRRRNVTTPWFLEEMENNHQQIYPKLVRNSNHWGCNYMVHDSINKTPYFYSRCVGTAMCPSLNTDLHVGDDYFTSDEDGDSSLDQEKDPDAPVQELEYAYE